MGNRLKYLNFSISTFQDVPVRTKADIQCYFPVRGYSLLLSRGGIGMRLSLVLDYTSEKLNAVAQCAITLSFITRGDWSGGVQEPYSGYCNRGVV